MVERVEAEADEATGQHYLPAEDPNGLYAVLEDEEEDDFAFERETAAEVAMVSLRA